ncbi:MAG TPA: ABC transporter substrate-binding protein [Longimicrobiales bacterium]
MVKRAVQRIGGVAAVVVAAGCAAGTGRAADDAPHPGSAAGAARTGGPVRVGVVLPRSGSAYLERYGALVLEGVELAVREREASGGSPVMLEVVDGAGDPERAAAAVRELERRGAVAVIGPVLPGAADAAVRARASDGLVLVHPLGSEAAAAENAYAMNAPDALGAETLGRYAASRGWLRVGLLYPRTAAYRRQARAFAAALLEEGGRIVAEVPYDSGTTTFATHLKAIAAAAPQAVFLPVPERDVHQIAPQITYYGLAGAGVHVLGGDGWTAESVRRQVAARYLDGVVAATPLPPSSDAVGWDDFVARYEQAYRRSLRDPYPALGYDAMRLLLAGLDSVAAGRGDLAEAIRAIGGLRGATGVLMVERGRVVRRPFVVTYEQGELTPVPWPDDGAPPAPDGGWRDR